MAALSYPSPVHRIKRAIALNLTSGEIGVVTGFMLVLLAAIMNGAYAIPMRFMSRWKWENIWLLWTVLSLWAIPVLMTWGAVPHPADAYQQTSWASLFRMGLMGLLWGAGVLLLGMSFPLVGVAVGAAVGLGCAAAMGTLLPILYTGTSMLQASTVVMISLGVLMVLVGVGVCGFAGRAREQHQGTGTMIAGHSIRGFVYAGVGGTLTAALNLALAAGASITAAVVQQHSSSSMASIAVWLPVLLAGGIPGVVYTLTLLRANRTFGLFHAGGTAPYWPLVVVMGLLWLGSIVVYGNGVSKIGALGLVVGWPVFMSGAVIASAAWGSLFGEWKNSGKTAKLSMTAGVFCLMVAITILSRAGQ
jgi:L-rhamnose-H+ transport protein